MVNWVALVPMRNQPTLAPRPLTMSRVCLSTSGLLVWKTVPRTAKTGGRHSVTGLSATTMEAKLPVRPTPLSQFFWDSAFSAKRCTTLYPVDLIFYTASSPTLSLQKWLDLSERANHNLNSLLVGQ